VNPIIAKQLYTPLSNGPCVAMSPPVVRIQARFGNRWAAWGSGFFIGQWPSSIITARHVVALPQGIAPSDVRVEAFVEGNWSSFDATSIAFPSGGPAAADVAIVRIQGSCTTTLEAATMEEPCRVEIWGYPLARGYPVGSPLVVGCRAQPAAGQIRLDRPGRPGMSGGPVVAISDAGKLLAAVGIYLGTSPTGTRAHALIDDTLFASKDAAMNAIASESATPS
jgi:S1-C subfamily serine protease